MTQATKKKHVTREVIYNYEFPDEKQEIVQVIRGCGNNLHEVQSASGEQYLVSMPTKFRRSIWIKRGDYCVVTPIEEGDKVRAEISAILMKDQIRYFQESGKWPKEFDSQLKNNQHPKKKNDSIICDENAESEESNSEEDDFDSELVPNTNRVYAKDEEEEESSSDED